ncbi:S8 family serine peptidase [Bdellovibrio sp. 22V]|uniref:S8 family serine peptidase n=1 Tax=Bdellovibrio TaxID=958 RepID=UPI00254326E2|nr:S8 family serine peptidase [Bdellovibrio sp. 22V]WII71618.1 S8 family serine peptidase [Bdellovibrio sp. 22V]
MKLNVFAIILTVLFATAAQAERVIVIMKDKEAFKSAHMAYKMKGSYALKGFTWGSSSALAQVDGQVEDSLANLNTLIIDAKNDAEIEKLKANPAVAYVEKEIFHEAPRPVKGMLASPRTKQQKLGQKTPWGIHTVKAPQAWAVSNKGEGARVLVLDTGIDEAHPSLKANFEKGQDFTGDSNGSDYTDKVGHGTHVAGTIAGVMDRSGFTGVAPKAKVLAGRVCSDNGCSNIAIAQGINWGISEKVDVISMSLGGMWSTPAERDAVNKADKAGITVVAASGNNGTGKVSYPAALPTVIAVGAIDNTLKKADFSQYGPELAIVAPGVAVVSSVPQGTGRESSVTIAIGTKAGKVNSSTFQGAREVLTPETNVLVPAGLGKAEDFANVDVKGKYALIARGEIKFSEKVENAIKAGALGAVIYNNAPGLIQGALTEDGSVLPIAVFMIEQTVGQEIVKQIAAGKEVKATLQTVATDYAAFDGTSMATPHVSGVVALMKSANKALTGAQVKTILKQTAQPLGPNTANEYGAGLVNAEAAVNAALQAK